MNQQGFLVVVSGFSGAGKGNTHERAAKAVWQLCIVRIRHHKAAQGRRKDRTGEDYFFVQQGNIFSRFD